MIMKKGMVTLAALILLSGLLALILLFDEQIFAFFRAQMSQRKYYVEQSLPLQKTSQQQQTHICQNLPLNGAEKVKQVFFESSGAEDKVAYSVWCKRAELFKKSPTKGINENMLRDFISSEKQTDFQPHFVKVASILTAQKVPQVYWITQNQLEIKGNVSGILLAEENLTLTGKGRISGAVITGGSLKLEGDVTVAYGKAVVTKLVQEYSQWRLVDKSWSDLSAQDQSE